MIARERDEEPELALTRALDVFEREVRAMRAKRRDRRGGRGPQPADTEEETGEGDERVLAEAAE